MKAQPIRLLDVFLIGPLMIYAAQGTKLAPWVRVALVVAGVSTVIYNAGNYLKLERGNDNVGMD